MGLDANFYGMNLTVGDDNTGFIRDLLYWRNNWCVHDYIVDTIAGGKPYARGRIYLTVDGLEMIQDAIRNRKLPERYQFYPDDRQEEDIQDVQDVINWLKEDEENRQVYYQACW